jgi:CTP:molybdopterin cytidylyltransferase MocA
VRQPSVAAAPVVGLVLAAGSGSRLGRPKGMITDESGETWVARAVRVLGESGLDSVYVVIGASADDMRTVVPEVAEVVVADDWAEGMGASLRAGLAAVQSRAPASTTAVMVMLVDTPDITSAVVRRLLASDAGTAALGRSTYHGAPSHPVLIGRGHWAGVIASARGDRGARGYLAAREVLLVECGDLANGTDVDTQSALDSWLAQDPASR